MLTIILSGGIGAGKTQITNRLLTQFNFVEASPASVMKRALAHVIADQYEAPLTWRTYLSEMTMGDTKEEYRLLLQGYGEFFSNRDKHYWADKAADEAFGNAFENVNRDRVQGVVGDSIRRASEIMALKLRSEDALHVHLDIYPERQRSYLTKVRDMTHEQAISTLAHSSEHWLDDMRGKEYDADFHIDANYGDAETWQGLLDGLAFRGWYLQGGRVAKKVFSDYV